MGVCLPLHFQLSALRLFAPAKESGRGLIPLPLSSGWASFDYKAPDADIAGIVDEKRNQVWHIWGRFGQPHEAIFVVKETASAAQSASIVVELHHRDVFNGINLGRFRLSVCCDPTVFDLENNRAVALEYSDPWAKLAAAYFAIGDQPALDQLLVRHPGVASSIGDLYAARNRWDRAIAEYSKRITPETKDTALLAQRAEAYIAARELGSGACRLEAHHCRTPRPDAKRLRWFPKNRSLERSSRIRSATRLTTAG